MLSNQDKKTLRSLAHDEKDLVYIGKRGLTDTVYETFEISLKAHNLVKVNIQKHSPATVEDVIDAFTNEFNCELVNKTGRVIIFYKYHEEGRIKL